MRAAQHSLPGRANQRADLVGHQAEPFVQVTERLGGHHAAVLAVPAAAAASPDAVTVQPVTHRALRQAGDLGDLARAEPTPSPDGRALA
jgi:hypothetical protein